jgi:hypothetical protein
VLLRWPLINLGLARTSFHFRGRRTLVVHSYCTYFAACMILSVATAIPPVHAPLRDCSCRPSGGGSTCLMLERCQLSTSRLHGWLVYTTMQYAHMMQGQCQLRSLILSCYCYPGACIAAHSSARTETAMASVAMARAGEKIQSRRRHIRISQG